MRHCRLDWRPSIGLIQGPPVLKDHGQFLKNVFENKYLKAIQLIPNMEGWLPLIVMKYRPKGLTGTYRMITKQHTS